MTVNQPFSEYPNEKIFTASRAGSGLTAQAFAILQTFPPKLASY